jgi:hypothetical protein
MPAPSHRDSWASHAWSDDLSTTIRFLSNPHLIAILHAFKWLLCILTGSSHMLIMERFPADPTITLPRLDSVT